MFISGYQNALLLLITLPAVVALQFSATPLGPLDLTAAALMLCFIAFETVADNQQWRFQSRKRALEAAGRPLTGPDPDRYEQVNAHCDLLICGGGPAGLCAALVAGRAGLRVMLVDQDDNFGGTLNWERVEVDGRAPAAWVGETLSELAALPRVVLLPRTVAAGIYDHNVVTLAERSQVKDWRECLWTVRPRHILLTAGAIEQGLIFPGNDRPGIMLAGSVRHYLNRFAVVPGRRAVIATNNDSGYQTAFDLADRGIEVAAVVVGRVRQTAEKRFVVAVTDKEAGRKGMSAFIVDKDAPGLTLRRLTWKRSPASMPSGASRTTPRPAAVRRPTVGVRVRTGPGPARSLRPGKGRDSTEAPRGRRLSPGFVS